MFKTYSVFFIVFVDNEAELIDDTMKGILGQTYPRSEMRVLFMDNASKDGSYEKILDYIQEYPSLVSVYRMDRPTKPARLLKQASNYLRFSPVHFSMFLHPGDRVYSGFIEKAIGLMHMNGEIEAVYSNIDICHTDKSLEKQEAIFTDNCIIDKEVNYGLFFNTGIGAKVQAMFRGLQPGALERRVDMEKRIDRNDWMGAAFPSEGKIAYLTESFGYMMERVPDDVMFDLMTKAYSLKSQFYMTETVANYTERQKKDWADMEAAYKCIAENALLHAIRTEETGDIRLAEQCLMFAEMMCLDIVQDEAYILIKKAIENETSMQGIREKIVKGSVEPPRDCFIF